MTDKEFFYATYKETATAFRDEILTCEDKFLRTFPSDDLMRNETFEFMATGGKRLRTVLARLVTKFLGREEKYATAALDLFHKFLLCHDDIMDRDRMRWGKPTLHARLEQLIEIDSEKEHFGNGLAVVAGDLIAAMSYRMILESELADCVKVTLMRHVCRTMDEVGWGWYDQLLMDYEKLSSPKLSYERIRDSIVWVTGKYTMSFPLRFGYAIMEREMPIELEMIADDLGVLFQTGDDLIGIFGDVSISGKSNYGDIVQGKKTLPIWFAYERACIEDKQILVKLVGKKDISEDEIGVVREIVRRSGAYDYTHEYMAACANKIKSELEKVAIPEDLRRFMNGFVDYLRERDS
jgi:geranylgeranyl pyrophosphate synthase